MTPLDANTVLHYLRERGVVPVPPGSKCTALEGGVSGVVLLVDTGERRWVVKQSLARLRVASEWLASPERALTEAAALDVLGAITPGRTPEIVDVDADTFTLTMTAAPPSWKPWRDMLLDGSVDERDQRVAATLGDLLGRWHTATWQDTALARRFDNTEALEQLRITPFHRTVGQRHPEVSAVVARCVDDLLRRRECLVHGDFSPKNVLTGSDGLWVLDAEVAHVGAPVFDVAFLQCHLLLKALHRPSHANALHRCAESFLDSYARGLARPPSLAGLGAHTACLLLARVDGDSPAGYLDDASRTQVRDLALSALRQDDPGLPQIWDRATDRVSDHVADHVADSAAAGAERRL